MSGVKYTSLYNNGYRYQEIASNHILLTSSTGYSSIAPDVDGAVLMSTGNGWSMSTDITTDTELSAYSNSLKIYIDTYTSDSELSAYSNQVSIALQNLNGNFNNYYDKTHFDLVIEAYSNNAELVYLTKADATNTYATKSDLTAVDNKFSNYYTSSQIDNTLANYSTSSEIAEYYYNKSQINTSIAACVQTTDYNSDLSNLIYTTTGLTSSSILIYQNGKSTLNLPATNGNYMLNNSNNTYSFTEYIGNDYVHYNITYPVTTTFSLLSTDQEYLSFTPEYSGNYLIAGTIDIYIDDITLLTPPEDSTLLDYEWIDTLPIINISVGGVLTFQYVVKQNQPLQTIPINIVYFASNSNTTISLGINCQVTTNTDGPSLEPSNIFVRPSKYNNNLRIVKM